MKDENREGDLKIWWVPQLPMKAFEVSVPDLQTASLLLDTLADYDRFQFENKVKPDYSNAGGLLIFEDGEWFDWEDDDGNEFDEVRRVPELMAAAIAHRQKGQTDADA
jgi:Superinfection exclusion gene product 17